MTDDQELSVLLHDWLIEGPREMPDRVVDVVAQRIRRQPQRPAWRLDRRLSMNTSLKAAAALAAVILVAVVGYSLLPGPSTGVGGPPPSPSPTASPSPIASASPSAAPSASAVFPPWYTQPGNGAGILPAGSQTTRQFLVGSTFTIPEGWVNDGDYTPVYSLFPNTPANQTEYTLSKQTAQNILLTDTVSNNMFAICDATGLFQGATASKVMDVVVANRAFSTTEPVDVTIGGLSGRQVDIQLSPDWTGSCPLSVDDPPTRNYEDARNRLIVLDTPAGGTIGIAIGSLYSSDFEAFLAEAMPIIESFQFNVTP